MGIPVSHVRHTETNRTMPHASFASRYINRSDNMCTECTALTCLLCKRIATPAAFVDRVDENSVSPDVRAVVPQDLLFSLNNTISQLQCSSSPSISAIFTFEFKRVFFTKIWRIGWFCRKTVDAGETSCPELERRTGAPLKKQFVPQHLHPYFCSCRLPLPLPYFCKIVLVLSVYQSIHSTLRSLWRGEI